MVDEWKNEDGQQSENGQQQNAPPSGQDTMTQEDETSETSSDDASFGQSGADGSTFIGSQSAGLDENLPDQDPQSDFAERDALTQENDDGMGEAGR